MRQTFWACACAVMLLCTLALSQSVTTTITINSNLNNDEHQSKVMEKLPKILEENHKLHRLLEAADTIEVTGDETRETRTLQPEVQSLVPKVKRQSESIDDDTAGDTGDDKIDSEEDDEDVTTESTSGKNESVQSPTKPRSRRILNRVPSTISVNYDHQTETPSWHQFLSRKSPFDIITEETITELSLTSPTVSTLLYETSTTEEPTFKRYMKEFMNKKLAYRNLIEARMPSGQGPIDHPPLTREKVGMIVAFVGTLLVKQIPEDTFFDMEDGNTRNLELMLRFADRRVLPSNHWLQFDEKKQELYGLPGLGNVGVEQYLVTAIDKNRGKAHHLLNIKVVKGPALNPNVELYLTLEASYMEIAYSARNKRNLIEKLAYVFGHGNKTDIIRMSSITDTPTTIKWYNTTLPSHKCPQEEIDRMIHAISGQPKEHFKDSVEKVFAELKVISLKVIPVNKCINRGKPPREIVSIYSGVSASKDRDVRLGVSGLINVKVGERKLVSFVIPTIIVALIIFTSLTVLYLLYSR